MFTFTKRGKYLKNLHSEHGPKRLAKLKAALAPKKKMPLLVTFQNRAVKRRRRIGNLLHLTLYASVPGQRGEKLIVTQQAWDRFGRESFVTREQMPDVRRLGR